MPKVALITGVTGQDGAYLAQLLLGRGYAVYGTSRGTLTDAWRLRELGIEDDVRPLAMDLLDEASVRAAVAAAGPNELYNLAAQSSVALSFKQPVHTAEADGVGVARLLEAVRESAPDCRFFQASSSELFGGNASGKVDEEAPLRPRSPYGAAKLYAHTLVGACRETWGLFACSGILFNHESPLRGREFVTRKITAAFAQIRGGRQERLELGNLDAKRDWGFAGDFAEGMWRSLQADAPNDYIFATGQARSVREFVEAAARATGFDLTWEGEGPEERGIDRATGQVRVIVNPDFYRPIEPGSLVGDATRARDRLGWTPQMGFDAMVQAMVEADLKRAERGELEI